MLPLEFFSGFVKFFCSDLVVVRVAPEAKSYFCLNLAGPRRVSNTYCALSSVARLSVSMTMSMSSGLFSMAEDDTDRSDDRSDGDHRDLSIELLRAERRHSLPGNIPSKMSDIEEESSSARDDIDIDSPINSSGIRIIIDEGSSDDLEEPPSPQPQPSKPATQNASTEIEMEELNSSNRVEDDSPDYQSCEIQLIS